MTLYRLNDLEPQLPGDGGYWIAPSADIVGNVHIGSGVSIWFGTTIRGDNEPITIGAGSNIQEQCVFHTDPGFPLVIGEGATIGHRALLHGCTIGDNALIGMGAIVLNGAKIGANCLIGAGALITEGKEIPDNSLVMGAPGKVVRTLSAEQITGIKQGATHYVANGQRFAAGLEAIDEKK